MSRSLSGGIGDWEGGWDIVGSLLCMLRMYLCMQAENSAQKSR